MELFAGPLDCIIVLTASIMELVCTVVGVEVAFAKNPNVLEMVSKSMVEDPVAGVVNTSELDDPEKKDFETKSLDGEREPLVVLVIDSVEVTESVDNVGDPLVEELITDVCDNNPLVKERLEVESVLVVGVKLPLSVGKIVDEFSNKEINDESIAEPVDKLGVGLTIALLLALNTLLTLVSNGCEVVTAPRSLDTLLLKSELIKLIRMVDDVCDGINDVKDESADEDKILELS